MSVFYYFATLPVLIAVSALHLQTSNKEDAYRYCPSMFVAVVSSLPNGERRQEIRSMWQSAGKRYPTSLQYKFTLCTRDGIDVALQHEQDVHRDLVFMDCEEGYLNGILTRKVASAMRYYLKLSHDLFMKIDDDTYISTDRLCSFMDKQRIKGIDILNSYMGVFAEGDETMVSKHPVIRDPNNQWYEPRQKYNFTFYPTAAKGGPGYILSRPMVAEIIRNNISEKFELNNEDKAVGYWVTKLKSFGLVKYVNIPGTDGYEEQQWIVTTGKFKDYPHILHHHLDGVAIACLHDVEFGNDPKQSIDHCLSTQGLWRTMREDRVRIHMPY
jgi:hypothetical protein